MSKFRLVITVFAFGAVFCVHAGTSISAQEIQEPAKTVQKGEEKGETKVDDPEGPKRPWRLTMSKEEPHTFSLKANEANLHEVTQELARLSKVPFFVSPILAKQKLTFEFSGINLEGTVRMFAPQSYIDYEIGGDEQQPKALGVYLQALNEAQPSITEVVKGTGEAILIEGDTEDGVGDEETQKKRDAENPLKIRYERNNLSVRARKQPLAVVLYKIANELGIPFEMKQDSPDVVDVDFTNYTVEQALRALSPSVRFFYRLDLQTYDVQPLRIVLSAPRGGRS